MKNQNIKPHAVNLSRVLKAAVLLCCAAVFILPSTVLAGIGNAGNPGIIPPQAHPHGMSYSEWSAAWWQWALSFPADPTENPVMDPDGSLCHLGDMGKVWFLAGNFGGVSERECTVPTGTSLFFPVANLVWVQTPFDPPIPDECVEQNYECLREIIRAIVDNATYSLTVDGRAVNQLSAYRVESVVFDVEMPENNLFGLDPGIYGPCVDDGIYVMLPPLRPGEHEIHIAATFPDFGSEIEVTYLLNVVPGND